MNPVVPIGLGIALIAFLLKGKKGDGSDLDFNGPGGGKGGGKGGGTDVPKGPRKGPGGKGDVFGNLDKPPIQWDPSSNQVLIAGDCSVVLVGEMFWPDTKSIVAMEAPSLKETLELSDDNSVVGFVDYLMNEEGLQQPEEIAARIMLEISAYCWDVPPSQWHPAYRMFFEWLMDRLVPYVEEGTIGDFDPNE